MITTLYEELTDCIKYIDANDDNYYKKLESFVKTFLQWATNTMATAWEDNTDEEDILPMEEYLARELISLEDITQFKKDFFKIKESLIKIREDYVKENEDAFSMHLKCMAKYSDPDYVTYSAEQYFNSLSSMKLRLSLLVNSFLIYAPPDEYLEQKKESISKPLSNWPNGPTLQRVGICPHKTSLMSKNSPASSASSNEEFRCK